MSAPAFMAAISCGSSAAFSTQADLPLVNMENFLSPIGTETLEFPEIVAGDELRLEGDGLAGPLADEEEHVAVVEMAGCIDFGFGTVST